MSLFLQFLFLYFEKNRTSICKFLGHFTSFIWIRFQRAFAQQNMQLTSRSAGTEKRKIHLNCLWFNAKDLSVYVSACQLRCRCQPPTKTCERLIFLLFVCFLLFWKKTELDQRQEKTEKREKKEREKTKNPQSLVTFPSLTHHRICVPAPPSPKSMKKCSAFCIIIDTILHSNTAAIVLWLKYMTIKTTIVSFF